MKLTLKIKPKYILLAVLGLLLAGFIAYIVVALIPKNETDKTDFEYYSYKESTEPNSDYVLENDDIKFTLDPVTTHFSVLQKRNGRIWYSNPIEAENDPIALPAEKKDMESVLLATYSTENGVDNTYDSRSYSVDRKTYSVEKISDGIQVDYMLGNVEKTYILPLALTEDRMDDFVEKFSQSDKNLVLQYYREYDIDNLLPSDNEDALLKQYPMLEEENVYVIRDGIPDYMKKKIEALFATIGYTYSDYEEDAKMYSGGKVKDIPLFNISVVYRIEGPDLIVDVPFEKINYRKDFPLIKLAVLPYMGAGGTDENGYILVPEGGGSLIHFNNGKLKHTGYYSNVYGWDYCTDRKTVVTETRNAFPVFGMACGNASFVSIIGRGASWAGINADISGRYNSYNTVYASYRMVHSEEYDISSKSNNSEFVYEKSLPKDGIQQRYRFVNSGNYTDMAFAYQQYLLAKNAKMKRLKNTSTPVAVEIIGAIDKIQQFAGFPKLRPLKVTSYTEAGSILQDLSEKGIKNMHVRLTGFLNGGMRQKLLTSIDFISVLGGKKDFTKMAETFTGNKVYLDGITQYARNSGISNGFLSYRDSARLVSSELAKLYPYSEIWFGKKETERPYYLLKPNLSVRMLNNLQKASGKYGLSGISLRDTGYELSADYNPDHDTSREAVKDAQCSAMQSVRNRGSGIMISGGNAYAVPYADFVTDMEFTGHRYSIIDEQVPFYQIVLHGYVNYAGQAVNLSPDYTETILESARYGAGLYFVFMKSDAGILQNTSYTQYFGANYDTWGPDALKIYERYNRELAHTFNEQMTGYDNIAPNVSVTVYEDGTSVYVNSGYTDYCTADGRTIPARDYLCVNPKEEK